MKPLRLLLTCEHAGHAVPEAYRHLFEGRDALLQSHRGWDRGALMLAQGLAGTLQAPLFHSTITRQLVDLNRTAARTLFSPISRALSAGERERVLARHYHPYRQGVESAIAHEVAKGSRVLHLSVHSFTPVLRGQRRHAEVGLLYDPARKGEAQFCAAWKNALQETFPRWRVRRNYPYRGRTDGFTTYLRTQFSMSDYLGIELEINQRLVHASSSQIRAWATPLSTSLKTVIHANH